MFGKLSNLWRTHHVSELERTEKHLEFPSTLDTLVGVLNRRYLVEHPARLASFGEPRGAQVWFKLGVVRSPPK